MTSQIDRRPSHSTGSPQARARRALLGSTRQARTRRVYDGVVASYIREISAQAADRSRHS